MQHHNGCSSSGVQYIGNHVALRENISHLDITCRNISLCRHTVLLYQHVFVQRTERLSWNNKARESTVKPEPVLQRLSTLAWRFGRERVTLDCSGLLAYQIYQISNDFAYPA